MKVKHCRICKRRVELKTCVCGLQRLCLRCYTNVHQPECGRAQAHGATAS